jgi:hypothetical protein
MGRILDLARRDSRRFITQGGFEVEISISTPDGLTSLDLKGFATKHFINFDTDGLPVNSKNVHINISETDLSDALYPVRNARNEVSLLNHLVSYKDSTGVSRNFAIKENFPDETLGLIVCILTDYTL